MKYEVWNKRSGSKMGVVEVSKTDIEVVEGPESAFEALLIESDEQGPEAAMEWFRNWEFVPVDGDDDVEKELSQGIISKIDEERRMVFGWAYVTHDKDGTVVVDKSGEFVDDVEEIEKAAYKFVMTSRAGDFDHTNMKSAEMVESMVFTPEKIEKMGLPAGTLPSGWWVGWHFPDEADWEEAKKRKAFSIHGKGTRKEVSDDG